MEIIVNQEIKEATKWFSPGIHPKRIGVYQTKFQETDKEIYYSFWDGEYWGDSYESLQMADYLSIRQHYRGNQTKVWRGLTKESISC